MLDLFLYPRFTQTVLVPGISAHLNQQISFANSVIVHRRHCVWETTISLIWLRLYWQFLKDDTKKGIQGPDHGVLYTMLRNVDIILGKWGPKIQV